MENDSPFEAYLKLQKKDAKTGKFVTLSNAIFELYKYNEDTRKYEKMQCKVGNQYFDNWTTNEQGFVNTETKMEAGKYQLKEIKIPNGFIELEQELFFNVDNRNKTLEYDSDWDAWITVTAENLQPTGTLKINKTLDLRDNVDLSLIEDIDFTKIAFELKASEDIIDYADGSVIYKQGTTIGKYALDTEGKLTVKNLPMGKYELKEISTIDGAVIDNTSYEVIFEQKDAVTKEYTVELNIENKTTLTELSKKAITGDDELEGAELTLLNENGEIIEKWISTKASHKIEGLVVGKKYVLREDLSPLGYVKATDIEFTVENTTDAQKIVMIDKICKVLKTDVEGNIIEGVTLSVISPKTKNIIDKWSTTKETHRVSGLIEGENYILREESFIDGYVKAKDVEFTVTTDKKTQEIIMIDKIVEMSKVNISGEEIEGATIQVLDKDGNIVDEWISEKTPHRINNLIEGETYILHEEICVDGYVKATDMEFTVTTDKQTQKITMVDKVVLISKIDLTTSEELPGAELTVTDIDGNIIDTWVSSDTPHQVTGLEEGKTYTLTEVTCPYGYEQAESITFTVTTNKETQLIEMKDMPILKTIRLIKTDKDSKETIKADFKFGIYEDAECNKLIKEVVSDKASGTVTFEDLRYKVYYIKELSAPKGYQLSDKILKLEINDKGVFIDGTELTEENDIYSFEFENEQIPKVQTGNEMNYILLISVVIISILVIAFGIVILKRNNQ